MKKIIIFLFIGVLSMINSYAQTKYSGKVIDKLDQPVVGATIMSVVNKNKGAVTDLNGNFQIELTNSEVTIASVGYQTITKKLISPTNTIVLTQSTESLKEVIVSASREIQKRSEVPASIGVITTSEIDDLKPTGIEEIINQVPGVFMSTSKASGNEQHFTALRSPISTGSLFLYLEDGIPIRPTAIFNHNTLLEMNSTAFGRVEVLKGPASSIYGSEAIGGAFNFITKEPKKEFGGSIGGQMNSFGLSKIEAEFSTTAAEKYGFYVGGGYTERNNGPIDHSDYEKFAITFKNVNKFSEDLTWTNFVNFADYRSDTTGSLSEEDYTNGNYESDNTFTERVSRSLRFRSTLDKRWNEKNKTSFNFIYRDNMMDQVPTFRIRQSRNNGALTGAASGEINSNQFTSLVGLIQHKIDFDFANSSLILGATGDFSKQDYIAETLDIVVNTATGVNESFIINEGDFILNYFANISNYGTYGQFEISPLENLKITGALRFDEFRYDYDNLAEDVVGVADTKVYYRNLSPKLGVNYNLSKVGGFFANYSQGFTPPQTATLFRNGDNDTAGNAVFDLKPARFNNYEVGGYFGIPSKLKIDITAYYLQGLDRLISLTDDDGNFINRNAGETESKGIELGVKFDILENLWVNYNGSYATHEYIDFIEDDVDYSGTDIPVAPNYIASASINYRPFKNLLLTLEHEQIGKYNTSFEGQVAIGEDIDGNDILGGTTTYDGHNVFNFKAKYTYKQFDIWGQALNITDELFAVRASYNTFSGENSYSVGSPVGVNFGIKYNF